MRARRTMEGHCAMRGHRAYARIYQLGRSQAVVMHARYAMEGHRACIYIVQLCHSRVVCDGCTPFDGRPSCIYMHQAVRAAHLMHRRCAYAYSYEGGWGRNSD